MAALYAPFEGSHPSVQHTNVLTCCPLSDSALWERGGSCFFKVYVLQSRGVAKVDEPARARTGVTRTCEQYIIYLLLCAETVSVVKNKAASVFKKLKYLDALPYLKIRQAMAALYMLLQGSQPHV